MIQRGLRLAPESRRLLDGQYPAGLYRFGVGMMRWTLRVEAYVLLMRDEYPPFSLQR